MFSSGPQRRTEEATAGRKSHETVTFYRRKAGQLTRLFEHSAEGAYRPFLLKELTGS
jgi:hypothetical protein